VLAVYMYVLYTRAGKSVASRDNIFDSVNPYINYSCNFIFFLFSETEHDLVQCTVHFAIFGKIADGIFKIVDNLYEMAIHVVLDKFVVVTFIGIQPLLLMVKVVVDVFFTAVFVDFPVED